MFGLLNFGVDRKQFECVSTKEKLFALNTSKNTFITLLFTLFSGGLLFTGFIQVLINGTKPTNGLLLISILHFIVGVAGIRHFLWLINGKQELTIENGKLTISKRGTFLVGSQVYSFDKVVNIRQAVDENKQSLLEKRLEKIALNKTVLFRQTLGQILFEYNGSTIRVFSDMDSNEKKKLIAEMLKQKQEEQMVL
ncbi:MAG: hypothetical protein WAQ28_09845 [Bacteroidia bacterium]|jgi:hypothetical protein